MKKTYTLYRGGEPIKIEKEEEFFTAILPDQKAIDTLNNRSGVKAMKRVYRNIYKVKTTRGTQEKMMRYVRADLHAQTIAHHAYNPIGDKTTRYYITDKIIINFKKGTRTAKISSIFEKHGLHFLKKYANSKNAYLVKVTKSAGMNPVKLTNVLRAYKEITSAEPNLVNRFMNFYKPKDGLFKKQWHLYASKDGVQLKANASVDAPNAWKITRGSRKVTVAVIDDGFDLKHPDLKGDGKKIVHPRDFVDDDDLPMPVASRDDYHGTPCAGVAIGEETGKGIVGIAPKCSFLPIRFDLAADDDLLWEIFDFAGKYADVISCSWGPVPVYAPLSKLLKDKFTELTLNGGPRKKGCVICFAAGNYNAPINDPDNETFDWYHPGYGDVFGTPGPIINGNCAHPDVVAVAASTSLNKKAAYSNWGKEISVAAPSNNWHPIDQQEFVPGRGIWTADNEASGTGFTSNSKYTGSFGGTSSATPLVAGIAALIISANPDLSAKQVKKILEETTDKIEDKEPDIVLGNKKGTYKRGHSEWFGHGKVNAAKAVTKAKAMKTGSTNTATTKPTVSKSITSGIYIIAALANPKGRDSKKETITLLNTTPDKVSLNKWVFSDGKKKKKILRNIELAGGEAKTIALGSSKFTLTNTGMTIQLLNDEGKKVHEVKYTKSDTKKDGWTIRF